MYIQEAIAFQTPGVFSDSTGTYHLNLTQTTADSVIAMEHCVNDIGRWILSNHLMIKDGKTEVMLVGTPQQLAKITLDGIKVGGEIIVPAIVFRNLGVNQDNHLKMDKHVSSLCSRSFYQLYRVRRIRKFLTPKATQTLVHAFITINLDCCNSLFYGMPRYLLNKLH